MLTHQRTTADGTARRISDFLSDRQFRALGLYQDFYRPTGVDYRLAATVPGANGGLIGVALNRTGRDFEDSDVRLVNLLRRHIGQVHALNALLKALLPPHQTTASDKPALTDRQRQILQLVNEGRTDRAIGRLLGISTRTVQAHLQHTYRALGANSRTEAIARLRGAREGHA